MAVKNKVCLCSNYATNALQAALDRYAEFGYKLVSTEMAKDKYGSEIMYLFFAGEFDEGKDVYEERCARRQNEGLREYIS